jgi:hypothetical protein
LIREKKEAYLAAIKNGNKPEALKEGCFKKQSPSLKIHH